MRGSNSYANVRTGAVVVVCSIGRTWVIWGGGQGGGGERKEGDRGDQRDSSDSGCTKPGRLKLQEVPGKTGETGETGKFKPSRLSGEDSLAAISVEGVQACRLAGLSPKDLGLGVKWRWRHVSPVSRLFRLLGSKRSNVHSGLPLLSTHYSTPLRALDSSMVVGSMVVETGAV